mmetsp:Transcript_18904/g.35039  ORF Transcript_18904/g.35039 Transcript_18904/m.35039 type:complete len:267 (-) Transcript_18904:322-1122(-)
MAMSSRCSCARFPSLSRSSAEPETSALSPKVLGVSLFLFMCFACVSNRSSKFSMEASICPSCRTLSLMLLMLESTLYCACSVAMACPSRFFCKVAISLFLLRTSFALSLVNWANCCLFSSFSTSWLVWRLFRSSLATLRVLYLLRRSCTSGKSSLVPCTNSTTSIRNFWYFSFFKTCSFRAFSSSIFSWYCLVSLVISVSFISLCFFSSAALLIARLRLLSFSCRNLLNFMRDSWSSRSFLRRASSRRRNASSLLANSSFCASSAS